MYCMFDKYFNILSVSHQNGEMGNNLSANKHLEIAMSPVSQENLCTTHLYNVGRKDFDFFLVKKMCQKVSESGVITKTKQYIY